MRIPTFSRQTEPDTAETGRPAAGTATTPSATDIPPVRARREADTLTDLPPAPKSDTAPRATTPPPPPPAAVTHRPDTTTTTNPRATGAAAVDHTPAPVGPKPRASLLATLGLVLGVVSAMLVLSGPLLGYGIGVAALALVLSLAGIHATGKRHVAGKSDALLGMVLSLGAIVLGVLALTGSLSWLGTDVQPVTNLREWLDAKFVDRF
jgi:hypothetical protein